MSARFPTSDEHVASTPSKAPFRRTRRRGDKEKNRIARGAMSKWWAWWVPIHVLDAREPTFVRTNQPTDE